MRKRIAVLVAIGFALLLALGILTSLAMIVGLRETMTRAQASQAAALEVRASIRNLRADFLSGSDAVSHLLIDPGWTGAAAVKRRTDDAVAAHLAGAAHATRRPDLKAILSTLRRYDRRVTDPIEDQLLTLATTDPERARALYLEEYGAARTRNMALVDGALAVAVKEVAEAADYAQQKARETMSLAWLALALFAVVGTTGGLRLSGAVERVARGFENAARQVSEQRDHLRAVTTAMRGALTVLDARGRVTTVNEATCDLLDYTSAELTGTEFIRYVQTDGRPPARMETRNEPVTFVARDGTQIPVSVSAAPLRATDGTLVGSVWVAHDMRDHLRMLAEVEAARDAALEGSRTKSEFLANMSHEIRTPMHAIIGYTDIVLESELAAEQRWALEAVRRSALALLEIINDILDLSKVEAGRLTLEDVPFALRATLGEIVEVLQPQAREKALALVAEVSAHTPERLRGDPTRLRQIVVNLVGNAIKFTDAGEVILRVAPEGPIVEGAVVLRVTVADTGIGIPPDKREVIFRAFTQADGSMTRRYGGTGLGLTIAAQLVGMMGGSIHVESEVGRGSVFEFTARLRVDEAA